MPTRLLAVLRDTFSPPQGKYPLGDPMGTPYQKVMWKLGFRLVPTWSDRLIGSGFMAVGLFLCIVGLVAIL